MQLRKYQEDAVEAVIDYWRGGGGHPLVVLPTGTGKALVGAALMTRLHQEFGARVLLATHVEELVSQNERTLARYWPESPRGIYHAALKRREGDAPLCLAGIHSIYKDPERVRERDVLLIDEAHLLSHKDDGMYRKLITHFLATNPGFRVAGLTATPYRMSTGMLIEDYGDHEALFDDVVYEMSILDAIKSGWINPILPYVSPQRIDVSSVGTKGANGDYKDGELQKAVDQDDITERIVVESLRAMTKYGRRCGITFAAGVKHAQHLTERFQRHGCPCEVITQETKTKERHRIFADAREGRLNMIVGVGTLTTGVDLPSTDILICARPTRSKGLWTQILGRGSRLSPDTGKTDCLLLDFTDNSLDIGPLDTLDGRKEKGEGGAAPMRPCPSCSFVHHISLRNCPECDHEYPEHELKLMAASRAGPVVSTQSEAYWMDVSSMRVRRHKKEGKPDSLRVDYVCGFRMVSKWLAIESERGRGMAKQWWRANTINEGDPPETVTEALDRVEELRRPGRVLVRDEGKFPEICDWDYSVDMAIPLEKPLTISEAYNRRFARAD